MCIFFIAGYFTIFPSVADPERERVKVMYPPIIVTYVAMYPPIAGNRTGISARQHSNDIAINCNSVRPSSLSVRHASILHRNDLTLS